MSLDLYQDQIDDRLGQFRPIDRPEPGVFDGFLKGTGMFAMRNFARAGSAVDLAGAAGPIVKEALGVGRPGEVDQYFKEHDDIFGSAIKYWTPKPDEVGVAAEVAGGLLSTIPLVIASPAFAVGATYMGTAEELMEKGVSPGKAQAVGAAQAVGLGLGVWMPILGQNLWQRIFVGGAGFNTAQGIVLRGASGALLEGTPAGEEFKAFDGKALTLDVLLGLAFGSFAHLSPAQRAQGAAVWERLGTWAGKLEPSQVDALAALRQAQHSNVDSAPGKLAGVQDVQAHVDRVRTALDQLAKGDQVAVDDKPMPQFEPDAKREAASEKRATALRDVAERVRKDEGLPEIQETEAPAAKPGGEAEPPPPRGDVAEGKAAGAEAPDPALVEAELLVTERPDLQIKTGADAEGKAVTVSAKDYLEQAKADAAKSREDAKLIAAAAQCLMGII